MSELISVAEARAAVLARVGAPLAPEPVPLDDALGRVLAADAVAPEDVPGFDNSAMDGFAVLAADTAGAGPGSPVSASGRRGVACGSARRASARARRGLPDLDRRRPPGGRRLGRAARGGRRGRRRDRVRGGGRARARHPAGGRGHPGRCHGPSGGHASSAPPSSACSRRSPFPSRRAPGAPGWPWCARATSCSARASRCAPAGSVTRTPTRSRRSPGTRAPRSSRSSAARTRPPRRATRSSGALAADVAVVCGGVSVGEHDHVKAALRGARRRGGVLGRRAAARPADLVRDAGRLARSRRRAGVRAARQPGLGVRHLRPVRAPGAAGPLRGAGGARHRDGQRSLRTSRGFRRATRPSVARSSSPTRGWTATPTGPQGSHVLTSMLGADALAVVEAGPEPARAGDRVQVQLLRA